MKKLLVLTTILSLHYSTLLFGWEVRVVPVTKDEMTGQWNGLFAHDYRYGWSDFRAHCFKEDEVAACIADMLTIQTHGVYALLPENIQKVTAHLQLENGDMIYCVPVPYKSAQIMHKKMDESTVRMNSKDKFAWLPIDEVLRRRTVIKSARGKNSLHVFNFGDESIRTLLKEYWHTQLLPELQSLCPKKPFERLQSAAMKTHMGNKIVHGAVVVPQQRFMSKLTKASFAPKHVRQPSQKVSLRVARKN